MSLTAATTAFLVIMASTAAAALAALYRRPSALRLALTTTALIACSLVVADQLPGGGIFRTLRLLSLGVFGILPTFLAASALLLLLRRGRPGLAPAAFVAACLIACVGIDAFWIEPHWLEVTRHRIQTDKLEKTIRIVVVADFQTDEFDDYERNVLEAVLHERPDLVLFAGDYLQTIQRGRGEELRNQLRRFLHEIDFRAPLGAYAVGGNTDSRRWPEIFEGTSVRALQKTQTVNVQGLSITGLEESHSFRRSLRVDPAEGFHIVLGHAPDFALGPIEADLLVAGHTHGGQVRLPFLGPILTFSAVPREWAAGLTTLPSGAVLAVSRGIGMERNEAPRMRFLCRPELMVIEAAPR